MVLDHSGETFQKSGTFEDMTFEDKVDFTGAKFTENVVFANSTFKRDAIFENATFDGEIDCFQTSFESDVKFSGAMLKRGIDLFSSTFEGRVSFDNSTLEKIANFQETVFNDVVDFSGTAFGNLPYGSHNFTGTIFNADVKFSNASFYDSVDFSNPDERIAEGARFESAAYFTNVSFTTADFSHTNFKGPVSFRRTSFDQIPRLCGATYSKRPDWIGCRFGSEDIEIPEWTNEFATIAEASGLEGKTMIDMSDHTINEIKKAWISYLRQNPDGLNDTSEEAMALLKEKLSDSAIESMMKM